MKRIGLTGGIATGKSTVASYIQGALEGRVHFFDCDQKVHQYLKTPVVVQEIASSLDLPLNQEGLIDRGTLRDAVFPNEKKRRQLESILHPMVRKDCLASLEEAEHRAQASCFIADVPLLFESEYQWPVDQVWVVACRPETQKQRLAQRSALSVKLMEQMIQSQLPIDYKIARADRVLWNEGPISCLHRQLQSLLESEIAQ